MNKVCNQCKQDKDSTEYAVRKKETKQGVKEYLHSECRECARVRAVKYREKHGCSGYRGYTESRKKANAKYRKTEKGKESAAKLIKKQRAENPLFRFKESLRKHSVRALKGFVKNQKTETLLGCSYDEARAYIEKQFVDGMSWENHGEWHIDHKIPLASATTFDQAERLCHFSNLQPLWAEDNLKKGSKMP